MQKLKCPKKKRKENKETKITNSCDSRLIFGVDHDASRDPQLTRLIFRHSIWDASNGHSCDLFQNTCTMYNNDYANEKQTCLQLINLKQNGFLNAKCRIQNLVCQYIKQWFTDNSVLCTSVPCSIFQVFYGINCFILQNIVLLVANIVQCDVFSPFHNWRNIRSDKIFVRANFF